MSPRTAAIRPTVDHRGSRLPFSIREISARGTRLRLASSCWVQPSSVRRSRIPWPGWRSWARLSMAIKCPGLCASAHSRRGWFSRPPWGRPSTLARTIPAGGERGLSLKRLRMCTYVDRSANSVDCPSFDGQNVDWNARNRRSWTGWTVILTFCQGEGRGFESRLPLQVKPQVRHSFEGA